MAVLPGTVDNTQGHTFVLVCFKVVYVKRKASFHSTFHRIFEGTSYIVLCAFLYDTEGQSPSVLSMYYGLVCPCITPVALWGMWQVK